MGLETATYVADLVSSNPVGATDQKSQGDEHLRLIKAVLQATFPGANRPWKIPATLAKTSNYSLLVGDVNSLVLVDTTSGNVTISAPNTTGLPAGWEVTVIKTVAANVVTVDTPGSETIQGENSVSLSLQYDSLTMFWTGSYWQFKSLTFFAPFFPPIDAAVGGNVLAPHENLKIVWASNATVTATADAVLLKSSTGRVKRFNTLNETPSIAASGANGLDTGAEGSSTWYYIWAIGKEDGTLDTLLSASATAPTMPAGYDYKGLIGTVRNNGSSNFIPFGQVGHRVSAHVDSLNVLSGGTAASFAAVDLSAAIPLQAKAVYLSIAIGTTSGITNAVVVVAPAGSGTTETYGRAGVFTLINQGTTPQIFPLTSIITTPQEIKYYISSGANVQVSIYVQGWEY